MAGLSHVTPDAPARADDFSLSSADDGLAALGGEVDDDLGEVGDLEVLDRLEEYVQSLRAL